MRGMEIKKRHGSARTMALFAYISVLIIGSFACDDQKDGSSGHSGKLRLSLTADTTSLKKGVNSNLTKAVSDEFEKFLTVEDYQIRIVTDKDTVKSYDRFDKMPSEIELPEGAYTIVASKGNNLPAEFENPYFEGSTAFTVKEGMSTPLEVTATLGNARITAEYTDDFKEAYSEYTVLLSSSYTTADLEIVKGETRPAYMQVDKDGTNIAIGIKLKKITEETEKTYYVPTALKLERRQNVRLVFKTDGEALDGIGLDIVLDDTMEEVTMTTEIPDFMWKPFKEPTLTATDFVDGDVFEFRSGLFDKNPYIGINMAGGIGSLNIKYWKDGEDEEDATIYNLATDAGVKAAKENHYTWTVGEETDGNMSKKKASVLYLKEGLNSLPSSDKDIYTYHYKIYGTDATGKAKESNVITFDAKVLPAEAPQIIAKPDDEKFEIIEGDELAADWMLSFTATGLIDEEQTKVVVNDGTLNVEYAFMSEAGREALKQALGVETEITNSANAVLTFPKSFTTLLNAPETGSKDYTFTFYLKDKKSKEYTLKKTVTVYAPVFTLETTENDAFARRLVLRAKMPIGNKEKLGFEYKEVNETDWTRVMSPELKQIGNDVTGILKGITPETKYVVRAVYNAGKRIGNTEITVTTEKEIALVNGDFEDKWTEKNISGLMNGAKVGSEVSLTSSVPNGWVSVNDKTFSGKKTTMGLVLSTYNSVPSTMKVDGQGSGSGVRLRTVGWSNSKTAGNSDIKLFHVASGRLFLGSYSFDHENDKDSYNYGVEFESRPSKVSAMYKYTPYNNDSFKVWAVVENRDGDTVTQLGIGELVEGKSISDWQKLSFDITYTNFTKRATHISIVFSSSSKCSDNESEETANLKSMVVNGEVDGYTHYEGSNLYIDNVELIYE